MTASPALASVIRPEAFSPRASDLVTAAAERLDIDTRTAETLAATLPFARDDTTAGVENEIQASVAGRGAQVDLPMSIAASDVFANICQMAAAGDTSPRLKENLEAYLHLSPDNVWENSWVYFPEDRLSRFARSIFEEDLRADKRMPGSPLRRDADRFRCHRNGERHVRIPVSYLMKLALAEAVGDSRTDAMHSILLIGP